MEIITIRIEKINKNGKKKSFSIESRSILTNYFLLRYAMSNSSATVVDLMGSSVVVDRATFSLHCNSGYVGDPGSRWLNLNGVETDDSKGIIIGSGTTPVTKEDYNLASKIPTSNIKYQETSFSSPIISSNDVTWSVARSFMNLSGASVTINEIGILAYYDNQSFLVIRDIIPSSVVDPFDALNVIYTFTFPY